MRKSKKLFLLVAVIFLLLLFYVSYDIARRTTFPGSKPQLKERIQNTDKSDSTEAGETGIDSMPLNKNNP